MARKFMDGSDEYKTCGSFPHNKRPTQNNDFITAALKINKLLFIFLLAIKF